jgi:hypothetical protein
MEGRGNHFDPDILDRFVALAPDLYSSFSETNAIV